MKLEKTDLDSKDQEELMYRAIKWSATVISGILTLTLVLKLDSLL